MPCGTVGFIYRSFFCKALENFNNSSQRYSTNTSKVRCNVSYNTKVIQCIN